MLDAGGLLSHELVVRAAWVRLEAWYRTQEWRPEPDLTQFRLDLPARISALAQRLKDGTYRPAPFKLLPYPKSLEHLRHYCLVPVEDQLAFAVFAVLLGPYIEFSLANNVFGNRWYRGMKRDIFEGREPGWVDRAFSLDASAFYLPYRRDYGLFRRVAAWSAAAMLNVDRSALQTRPGAASPAEYARDRLPDFVRPDAWPSRPATEGHWARLDLRLAYPSVRMDLLEAELRAISSDDHVWLSSFIEAPEFPKVIKEGLSDQSVRLELIGRLATALQAIRYEPGLVRDEHWLPKSASDFPAWRLPTSNSDHPGLPTGLAIAGLLFNAYMRPVDRAMATLRENRNGSIAYLRFADDIVLLGHSADDIAEAIGKLDEFQPGALNDRNLMLNVGKAKPSSWKTFLEQAPQARSVPKMPPEELITRERFGPFVTYLVERMSEIGSEDPRFGDPARRHLIALHELIRLELPDDEVKPETRLAFAANRISKAFLPVENGDAAQRDLEEIAESIRIAMRAAPQKFSMWRAAIRAAARRSMETAAARKFATTHLTTLIKEIANEPQSPDLPQTLEGLRRSFLRAIFWREIADVLADLRRVLTRTDGGVGWSARSWTFRAVDEAAAEEVHQWIANLDQWAAALYGPLGANGPDARWFWELDALVLAELSAAEPMRLAGDEVVGTVHVSQLDTPLPTSSPSVVQELLRQSGRTVSLADWSQRTSLSRLTALSIARVRVPLDASSRLSRTVQWLLGDLEKVSPSATTLSAFELGCLALVRRDRTSSQANVQATAPSVVAIQLAALRRGELLRRVRAASKKRRLSLFELIWSVRDRSGATFAPGSAPSVELPVRLALRMLREAIVAAGARTPFEAPPEQRSPVTWLLTKQGERLLEARLEQIWSDSTSSPSGEARIRLELSERTADWPMAPHPAFDLVIASGASRGDDADVAWSMLLHFLVALTGDERWLDRLCAEWGFRIPLDESWNRRAAAPMPTQVWAHLDAVARHCLNLEGDRAMGQLGELRGLIDHYLGTAAATEMRVNLAEFGWDRADVELTLGTGPLDVPMGTGPLDGKAAPLAVEDLPPELAVRLAQISSSTDWPGYFARFGASGPGGAPRSERQMIMREVTSAFGEVDPLVIEHGPVLLPEVSVPQEELVELQRLAGRARRAVLAGMLWRPAPMVVRGRSVRGSKSGSSASRFLINEAKLITPVCRPGDPRFPIFRTFTIRKPVPAVEEYGLCEAVSAKSGVEWRMLRGRTWYRFVHPRWGDFTVAICSDLTDPGPWRSLDGQVLHLFLVSYNKDIELFEQLTWVRAFELHANVVGVNHGYYGGSFVWSPKHDHGKEVARLRGRSLSLLAEVQLPVRSLARHQSMGEQLARAKSKTGWEGAKGSPRSEFKAPRPDFRRRPGP